jgi:broad specificity phosphatase PhoE
MRLVLMRHAQCHSNVTGQMLGARNVDGSPPEPQWTENALGRSPASSPASGPAVGMGESRECSESSPGNELTPLGQRQAQALGAWLAQQPRPTHLYGSPLQRVRQTWALLQSHCPPAAALEIRWEPRLVEIDQGIFSGLTWPEAQRRHGDLCSQLLQSLDWIPVPGAEAPQDCRQRAEALLAFWLQQHGDGDCLWGISHGGFLSHLVSAVLGCDRTWDCAISPTGLFEFELNLSRYSQPQTNRFNTALWKINRFNCLEHLEELELE